MLLHYYGQLRPRITHWYSYTCYFNSLCFSLIIVMTGSRSSHKKPDTKSRPLYAGHRLHSLRNTLADLSRKVNPPPVLMSVSGLRRVHMGSGALVSLYHTCQPQRADFSLTLTTCAFNTRRLRWFGADFRQQTPVDLPPSSHELLHKNDSSSLTVSCVPAAHGE